MRPALCFCVPAYGRVELARICLRQLRLTCDALCDNGIDATTIVVADDENLTTARELGFGTVCRDNNFVSRRFNDAIQLACDPRHNPHPADYAVPMGSDDFIDYRILLDLPAPNEVHGFQHLSFVREDGQEMVSRFIDTTGGCGIRVYPRQQMAMLGYRPADEDRIRACDTSIITNLYRASSGLRVMHVPIDPRQIVDWKSPAAAQLNPYETLRRHRPTASHSDPFVELAEIYPAESLDAMRAHYEAVGELVAA